MKVLVVGGGGREHAVVDALSRSPQVSKIYCAPGNAGIARQAECVPVKDTDVEGLLSLAREKEIDLTVVGPEAALVAGIVDRFREEGLRIFGPTKAAARIESSKEFAKDLMGRYGIPTAGYRAFDDYRKASEYVRSRPLPAVLKYDGLAAGKGVVIARTMEEALFKGLVAAGYTMKREGGVLISVRDTDKSDLRELVKEYVAMGFHIYATSGTASRLNSVGISSTLVKKPKEAKEGEKLMQGIFGPSFDYYAIRERRRELVRERLAQYGLEKKHQLCNFHFQDGTPAGTRQCPPEKKGGRAWYSVPDIA